MQVKVMTTTRTAGVEIDAADTSQVVNIFTTTPNIYIMDIFARVKTAFAGVTGPTVKLGTTTITNAYMASQSISVVGDLIPKRTVADLPSGSDNLEHPSGATKSYMMGALCSAHISHQTTPANIPIVATFESSSGNLADLTAGEIEFVMVYAE